MSARGELLKAEMLMEPWIAAWASDYGFLRLETDNGCFARPSQVPLPW